MKKNQKYRIDKDHKPSKYLGIGMLVEAAILLLFFLVYLYRRYF